MCVCVSQKQLLLSASWFPDADGVVVAFGLGQNHQPDTEPAVSSSLDAFTHLPEWVTGAFVPRITFQYSFVLTWLKSGRETREVC